MIVTEADLRLMKQLIAKGDFSELLILIERRLEATIADRQQERSQTMTYTIKALDEKSIIEMLKGNNKDDNFPH